MIMRKNKNQPIESTKFSDIKNELMPIEIQYLTNRFQKYFPGNDKIDSLIDIQSIDDLIKFLKKQNETSQSADIINTILIAKFKSICRY